MLVLIIFLLIGGVAGLVFKKGGESLKEKPEPIAIQEEIIQEPPQEVPNESQEQKSEILSPPPSIKNTPIKEVLPSQFQIDLPFTPQAPFAIWDKDHNEACEEAAILMVHFYLQGRTSTPEIANQEILKMIDYQRKNWSGHFDLEAKEVARLAKEFYGYKNARVVYDISIEEIKREIFKGNPPILPAAGRKLQNPYYKRPGPLYHMLVAIGWDEEKKEIVVNDPGTKRGKGFHYPYQILENALHEWNEGKVESGRRAMILLK